MSKCLAGSEQRRWSFTVLVLRRCKQIHPKISHLFRMKLNTNTPSHRVQASGSQNPTLKEGILDSLCWMHVGVLPVFIP